MRRVRKTCAVLKRRVCVCPELQTRRTEERSPGSRTPRRSAPPPSPPLLPLRLGYPLLLAAPLSLSCDFYSLFFYTYRYISLSFLSLFSSLLSYLLYVYLCVSVSPQCVCTLSPSPSKQSKPVPLDSLQLPLAPGLVPHTVSLYWPL